MLSSASPRVRLLSSDGNLVAMIRDGQDGAFETLYERHHRSILSFCRHLLGDAFEAEDAVQHTFMAAYRELAYTTKDITVRPWLFTIARNRCYSILRSRREQPTDDFDQLMTEGLSSQVQQREDLRELLRDMADLPDEQRAALVLSELDALSHHQIGDVLGVRPDKVKALVYQARSTLSAAKDARETPCEDIRHELSVGRGAALRRGNLRRHLRDCHGCREFRSQVERQRRGLRALLPVFPTIALKQSIFGGGATAGTGAAATVGGGAVLGGAVKTSALKMLLATLALTAGAGGTAVIVATGGLPIDRLWGHGTTVHRQGAAATARPQAPERQLRGISAGPAPVTPTHSQISAAIGGSTHVLAMNDPFGRFVVAVPGAARNRALQVSARARTSGLSSLVPSTGPSARSGATPAPAAAAGPLTTTSAPAPAAAPAPATTAPKPTSTDLDPAGGASPRRSSVPGTPAAGDPPTASASTSSHSTTAGPGSSSSSSTSTVPAHGVDLLGLGRGLLSHLAVPVLAPVPTGSSSSVSPSSTSPGAGSAPTAPVLSITTSPPAPGTASAPDVPELGVGSLGPGGTSPLHGLPVLRVPVVHLPTLHLPVPGSPLPPDSTPTPSTASGSTAASSGGSTPDPTASPAPVAVPLPTPTAAASPAPTSSGISAAPTASSSGTLAGLWALLGLSPH
jgi:RNA polymerase sigma factor (sigma-70 family)